MCRELSPASSRRDTGGVGGAGKEEVSRGEGMGEKEVTLIGGGAGVEEEGARGRAAVRPAESTCEGSHGDNLRREFLGITWSSYERLPTSCVRRAHWLVRRCTSAAACGAGGDGDVRRWVIRETRGHILNVLMNESCGMYSMNCRKAVALSEMMVLVRHLRGMCKLCRDVA